MLAVWIIFNSSHIGISLNTILPLSKKPFYHIYFLCRDLHFVFAYCQWSNNIVILYRKIRCFENFLGDARYILFTEIPFSYKISINSSMVINIVQIEEIYESNVCFHPILYPFPQHNNCCIIASNVEKEYFDWTVALSVRAPWSDYSSSTQGDFTRILCFSYLVTDYLEYTWCQGGYIANGVMCPAQSIVYQSN